MPEAITLTQEQRDFIVAEVTRHGQLNAAQIHHALEQAGYELPLTAVIQQLPEVAGLTREHNPFVGSMARWSLTPSES
jgi:hypothetical protein